MEFHHISVMPEETVSGLVTSREGIYVDCTLGGAKTVGETAKNHYPKGLRI